MINDSILSLYSRWGIVFVPGGCAALGIVTVAIGSSSHSLWRKSSLKEPLIPHEEAGSDGITVRQNRSRYYNVDTYFDVSNTDSFQISSGIVVVLVF